MSKSKFHNPSKKQIEMPHQSRRNSPLTACSYQPMLTMLSKSTAILAFVACSLVLVCGSVARASGKPVGMFEGDGDVGSALHPGAVDYDAATGAYTVSGSGENMWFASDAFHMVWKKVTGDVRLAANISFPAQGGNEHRKAVLIIRQSLDPDSAYADVALHGNGLTSLQYRNEKGGATHEIQANISAPKRLRIEKYGDFIYISLGDEEKKLRFSGASIHAPVQGTFYVGIGVCSHDQNAVEKAVFTNIDLATNLAPVQNPTLYSSLERISIASTDRRVVYLASDRFEAPNWTRDGTALIFNRNGHLYRLSLVAHDLDAHDLNGHDLNGHDLNGHDLTKGESAGVEPSVIDTGFANRCNNDHGISPDQASLAISDQSQEDNKSIVYIVPIVGGTPRRITQKSPSYWHGWSPDGKTLAFVGQRHVDNEDNFDIYAIPVTGGEEKRLTTAKGLDDGPEYSPDGKYIYFNSERTGHMQIWRMRADGSGQEQVFSDDWNNWFPHISPDGRWMVFLSYEPGVTGHPPNQNVMLRIMSLSEKEADKKPENKITVLARLFGGQGTINVPSWSPDSKEVAFVSYALVPDGDAAAK
jgi:TolB protein